MRVGILDILALPTRSPPEQFYRLLFTKQFASVTPQAISVWCRRRGHQTYYATYYGVGDPDRLLPRDLDVVFICCYSQASPLAYALAALYRQRRTLTVLGGPHAKAFPLDCQRFFDLVVRECDEQLVADILQGQFDPGSLVSSARPFDDVPSVEERLPEIRASAFFARRMSSPMTNIPMLASMGCPYQCNFCIDWNNPYRELPRDRLAADLRFVARNLPGRLISFHDPNFGVRFDDIFSLLESLPPNERPPYIMESSLTILKGERLKRLKDTNCVFVAPGVESWTDYSNKAGVGRQSGEEKVTRVIEHFRQLDENVTYLQANFIFGLDTDVGDAPIELTKRFMDGTPFAWPAINIPVPFGGTPLYDEYRRGNRILPSMPFGFYYAPYLVTTLKNYDPVDYYEKLIELFVHASTPAMFRARLRSTRDWRVKLLHWSRTVGTRSRIAGFEHILRMLRTDAPFRAFHEGRSEVLPEYYHRQYEATLGRFAGLVSRADRIPVLAGAPTIASLDTRAAAGAAAR
jgi:radical SAM superfamily enzyme YgiQ (UPF0313 family)